MSICDNFEGALMKALRSLEQHIDSLDIGRYTDRSKEELLERIAIVLMTAVSSVMAELLRKGMQLTTKFIISQRLINGLLIRSLIWYKTEQALKEGPLTKELLAEAKRMEFPDKVIAELYRQF